MRSACALVRLAAVVAGAAATAAAQETVPPPALPSTPPLIVAPPRAGPIEFNASQLDTVSSPTSDDVVLFAQDLHLRLVDRDLELRADFAVLWGDRDLLLAARGAPAGDPLHFGPQVPTTPGRPPLPLLRRDDPAGVLVHGLQEIYAEGHVYFREGKEQVVLAERLYQHVLERRGVIVDADAYGTSPYKAGRVDVHVRAAALRTLSTRELRADDAQFSTCAYGHPHYHVESGAMTLRLRSAAPGDAAGVESLALANSWLAIGETSLLPLPSFTARLDTGDSLPLKSVRAGQSKRFGAYVQTLWGGDLPDTARAIEETWGLDPARPLDLGWELDVDGYSRRGGALGPALQWSQPETIDGELGGYWIHDRLDHDFGRPFVIDHADRGRAWLRDRWTPIDHWRLDTEVQWLSDGGLQPEYFEREFKEEKEPESYAHLVRQEGTTRWRALFRDRLNDFTTQVDALPRGGFDQVGAPLFKVPLPSLLEHDGQPAWLVLTQSHDVGSFRLEPAAGSPVGSERVVRADSLLDLSTTVNFGPLSLRPFTAGRFTGWDRNTQDDSVIGRAAGLVGARSEVMVHRNFDAWMPSLGIDGLRHVVLLDADYVNVYDVSRDPSEIVQIDEVDTLGPRSVYLLAVRQRLQTHRGDGIVDAVEFDLELPLYPNAARDNRGTLAGSTVGETAGPLRFDAVLRPDFTSKFLQHSSYFAEGEWSFHDGALDVLNVGAAFQPTIDWSTILSWRVARGLSRVVTGELDWQLTDKWSVALLEQYDLAQDNGLEHRYELRRHGHDFTLAFGFERDRGDGDVAFTVALYPAFLRRGRSDRTLTSGRGDRPTLGAGEY